MIPPPELPPRRIDEADSAYGARIEAAALALEGPRRREALLSACLKYGRIGDLDGYARIDAAMAAEADRLPADHQPGWTALLNAQRQHFVHQDLPAAVADYALAADTLAEPGLAADARMMAAIGNMRLGQLAAAEADLRAVIESSRTRHGERLATAHNNLASLLITADRFAEALVAARQASALRVAMGDERNLPSAYNNVGVALTHMGDLRGAADALQSALAIEAKVPDSKRLGMYQANLALAYAGMGDLDAAMDLLHDMGRLRRLENAYDNADASDLILGQCQAARGDFANAALSFRRSLEHVKSASLTHELQAWLALAEARLGHFDAADAYLAALGDLTPLAPETGARAWLAQAWLAVGRQAADAAVWFERAAQAAAACHSVLMQDEITESRAITAERAGDLAGALLWTRRLYADRLARIQAVREAQLTAARAERELWIARARAEVAESERARLQEAHDRLSEAAEARRVALGVIVHDLRNPLAVIRGRADLLVDALQTQPDPAAALDDAEAIGAAADAMAERIERLLRQQTLDQRLVQPRDTGVDLTALLPPLVRNFEPRARQKRLTLSLQPPPSGNATLRSDPRMIEEIVENLLSNAIKFSPAGGAIHVRFATEGRFARLEIADEGPGFTAEDRAHLFERFGRLSAQPTGGESSTGLGLFSVKQLVDKLGGEIELRSTPGAGATFVVRLPPVSDARSP